MYLLRGGAGGAFEHNRSKHACIYAMSITFHIFVKIYVDGHLGKLLHGAVGKGVFDFCMLLTHFLGILQIKTCHPFF